MFFKLPASDYYARQKLILVLNKNGKHEKKNNILQEQCSLFPACLQWFSDKKVSVFLLEKVLQK